MAIPALSPLRLTRTHLDTADMRLLRILEQLHDGKRTIVGLQRPKDRSGACAAPPNRVFTLPGMMIETRTSSCRTSSIIASVIPTSPNLDAL